MAVYTRVPEDELRAFLAGYRIGAVLAVRGIAEGVENTNYLIEAESGRYVLTLYEKRVDPADLPFFLGLMEHLARRGIPSPLPVHDREGRVIRELAGRPAALVTFLEGSSPRRIEPAHCAELGRGLARMHLAGADFPMRRPNALSVGSWRGLLEPYLPRADELEAGLSRELARELDELERESPRALPSGVVHADLFPDNALFVGGRLSGIIDFYFACNDLFAYDIAICLNAWCFEREREFNITKARALLRGYREVRPLAPAEVEALPVLARGAAVRFLATRLQDWFGRIEGALVRPKDPMEYVRKLRFHRGLSRPGSYGLDAA